MDLKKLAEAVLFPIVAYALRWLFGLIGFALDEAALNALVAAIVAFLLAQVFRDAGVQALLFLSERRGK